MTTVRASILRTGMITPVGLGSAQTCVALACGVPAFEETPIHDRRFQPRVMALLPDEELPELDAAVIGAAELGARQQRMLRLAAPALQEVLDGVDAPQEIPLFLAGPCPLLDRPDPTAEPFLEQLQQQARVPFQLAASRRFPHGRAAGLLALQAAVETIERGESSRVLVGGVDTFLDLYLLGALDGRILSESVLDGFIPGEAAAFLLVSAPGVDQKALAHVVAVASAEEPGHLGSEQPYRGDGLASAVTQVLEWAPGMGAVRTVYASLNGEHLGAKEWGVALLRNRARLEERHRLEHPADCIGDTGAAVGGVLLGLAAHALHDDPGIGPCLLWTSSDGPQRAAAVLSAP